MRMENQLNCFLSMDYGQSDYCRIVKLEWKGNQNSTY